MNSTEDYMWIVIVGGIFCWCAAWGIGANDTANSWGSTVGAKAISVRNAAILAGIFEVIGSFALGANVGGTLKSKIVDPKYYCYDKYGGVTRMIGMLSVDLGTAIWLWVTSRFGLPVSTTHAAVGGICGFGIITRGWASIIWWETMGKIFISWVTSPLLSAIIGFVLQWTIRRLLFTGPPGSIYRKNHLWLPPIAGLFVGVAAVFAFYIGGKSNNSVKNLPEWYFGVTFGAVAGGMIIILMIAAWLWRKKNNIDLDAYKYSGNGTEAVAASDSARKISVQENSEPQRAWDPEAGDAEGSDGVKKETTEKAADSNDPNGATFFSGGKLQQGVNIYEGMSEEMIAAEQLWNPLCWIVASTESFAHGANDVGNAIGPYAAMIDSYNMICPKGTQDIPYWILGLGASGILIGLVTYGHRVVRTLGVEIAVITPQRACASEMSTVLTVLIATALAIPVSTTHCAVGAITGMSMVKGIKNVNWHTIWPVVLCIFITVPCCAFMTAAVFGFWQAAVFGPMYPGPYMFKKYANATAPGPWI